MWTDTVHLLYYFVSLEDPSRDRDGDSAGGGSGLPEDLRHNRVRHRMLRLLSDRRAEQSLCLMAASLSECDDAHVEPVHQSLHSRLSTRLGTRILEELVDVVCSRDREVSHRVFDGVADRQVDVSQPYGCLVSAQSLGIALQCSRTDEAMRLDSTRIGITTS